MPVRPPVARISGPCRCRRARRPIPPAVPGPGQRVGFDEQKLPVGRRHGRPTGALGQPATAAWSTRTRPAAAESAGRPIPRRSDGATVTARPADAARATRRSPPPRRPVRGRRRRGQRRPSPRAAAVNCAQACGLPRKPCGGGVPVSRLTLGSDSAAATTSAVPSLEPSSSTRNSSRSSNPCWASRSGSSARCGALRRGQAPGSTPQPIPGRLGVRAVSAADVD